MHDDAFNVEESVPGVHGTTDPNILDITYQVLSTFLALEVLIGSIVTATRRQSRQMNKKVRGFRILTKHDRSRADRIRWSFSSLPSSPSQCSSEEHSTSDTAYQLILVQSNTRAQGSTPLTDSYMGAGY